MRSRASLGLTPCSHPVSNEMEPERSLRRPDDSLALRAFADHATRNVRRGMERVRGGVREVQRTETHGEREGIVSEGPQSNGCSRHQLSAPVPTHWNAEKSETARGPAGGKGERGRSIIAMASIGSCSPRPACIV